MSVGREIHNKAEMARELDSDFLGALKLLSEAIILYQEEGDYFGLCDALSSQFLTYRHLYEKTDDEMFMVLAKKSAEAAFEIAQKKSLKDGSIMPAFRLAQAHDTLNELTDAISFYREAVELFNSYPPKEHNRPAVLADIKGHLAIAEYKNGDENALNRAMEALHDIKASDELQYNKDVWMSGAHMRIAAAINQRDRDAAKRHIEEAEKIVSSNKELKLRDDQLKKLRTKLNL